jgi:hypothetical protein
MLAAPDPHAPSRWLPFTRAAFLSALVLGCKTETMPTDALVGALDATTLDAPGNLDGGDSTTAPLTDAVPADVSADRIVPPDTASNPADAGPGGDGASPLDANPMPDATSHTDAGLPNEGACRPNGMYQRSCSCTDASLAFVAACGPGAEGPCWMYTNSCIDPGFVICQETAFARDATLRARCEQFCATVRASDPTSGCRF